MKTVEEVEEIHNNICNEARKLISIKGRQYCGVKQNEGDTLHSRRCQELVGIVAKAETYSLGRALEKLIRIDSMMKQNLNENEKIEDSVYDLINDVIFSYILYNEGLEAIL